MQPELVLKSEEAGAELAQLISRVKRGERIVVTRGGAPVATIMSATPLSRSVQEALERARLRRAKMRVEGRSIGVQGLLRAQDEERR
jgi:prevent-host-death family protein